MNIIAVQQKVGPTMRIKQLDERETEKIYRAEMVRDFPEEELKPFSIIRDAMRGGIYEPLAFYDDAGMLCAYAMQTIAPQCRNALLDYFAVAPARRGQGAGTAVLAELAEYYAPRLDTLIIECEHPAEAPDPAIARRRIGFYLRAGAYATAMESRTFGVKYQIYALPCGGTACNADINRDLRAIYEMTVPEPYYRGNVIFYGI